MVYEVSIYKSVDSLSAEIETPVEVSDPITAALLVMDRFKLRAASTVFVSCDYKIVARFIDVDLDSAPVPASNWLVSYDYS